MKKKAYEITYQEYQSRKDMIEKIKEKNRILEEEGWTPAPLSDKLEQPKQIIFPDWFAYLLLVVAIIFVLLNIK